MTIFPALRLATSDDLEQVVSLVGDCAVEQGTSFVESAVRSAIAPLLTASPPIGIWLVVDQSAVVGYLALTVGESFKWRGRFGLLEELYLTPEVRTNAVASHLLTELLHACERMGLRMVWLEAEPQLFGAMELFEAQGFVLLSAPRIVKLFPPSGQASRPCF